MKTITRTRLGVLLAVLAAFALASCDGGSDDDNSPASTHTIGGTVSGLPSGAGITLVNNGGDTLKLNADGAFTFATPVADQGSYSVAVAAQPTGETCSVANGTGKGVSANVTNVAVTCTPNPMTIGGTLTGLAAGAQVTLKDNGNDALTLNADGAFTFPAAVPYGGTYAVTVDTQPAGQTCTVTNFTGSNVTANVSNVGVTCSAASYSVSIKISGLPAGVQLTLENNGADPLTITHDGTYTFATRIAYQSTFAVSVATRPTGQVCSITGGTGSGVAADVTDIQVNCAASTGFVYTTSESNRVVQQFKVGSDGTLTPMATPTVPSGSFTIFIAVDPKGRYAYAVNDIGGNSISQYSIGADGSLTPILDSSTNLPTVPTGSGPQSIVIDPSGKYAYVPNQNQSISQYTIQSNGALKPMTPPTVTLGSTSGARGGGMTINPAGTFAYAGTGGVNEIWQYAIGSDGALSPITSGGTPVVITAAHEVDGIVIDPAGKHAYATSTTLGAGNDVILEYDIASDGTLQPILDGSSNPVTIAAGNFPGGNAVAMDAAGKNVYVPNFNAKTISQYGINADGTLTHIADVSISGPANLIALDPSGKYAYVPDTLSDIFQFSVGTDGTLTPLTQPSFTFATQDRPTGIVMTH